MTVSLPEVFADRYRIVRPLNEGDPDTVYLAEDIRLGREVVLEILSLESNAIERFHQKASVAAQIRHPNLCPVHDFGTCDGTPYLARAVIAGTPLSAFAGQPWPAPQALLAALHLASALQALHQKGLIHGALNPTHVLIQPDGLPMLLGFWLPVDYADVGPWTDVRALGAILFQLLTGQPPQEESARPSELRPDLDEPLDRLCLRALASRRQDRPQSMGEMGVYLAEAFHALRPPPRQPPRRQPADLVPVKILDDEPSPRRQRRRPPPGPQPRPVLAVAVLAVMALLLLGAIVAAMTLMPAMTPTP